MKKIVVLLFAAMTLVNMYAKKPATVLLVGDEVCAEMTQAEDVTENSPIGLGQVLPEFLPEGTILQNHAVEGATTKSFMDERQWWEVLEHASRRSILLINFGHHEYDEYDYRHYSTLEAFENNLMQMVKDAKKKGLVVVMVSPTAKCFFKHGDFHARHGAYAEGVRRVAKRNHLPLIDLEKLTSEWIESIGENEARQYFATDDVVRLNEAGAKIVAKMVIEEAHNQKVKGL